MRSHFAPVSIIVGTFFALPLSVPAGSSTPDVDRILLVVGQNVESVTNYVAVTGQVPAGVMSYTSTANIEGLSTPVSYGSGLIHAQYFVDNPAYAGTVIQLGLYLNGDLLNIVSGLRDGNIATIGNWIKAAGRPVYLRIGYEFDGPWNALPPDQYILAYRRIVDSLRSQQVTNVSFVWHSACTPTFGGHAISEWYPGDDYVDWAGISVFRQFDGSLGTVADIDNFCAFAKSHNKPIMIGESTAFGGVSDARWVNWFAPCLDLIRRHHIQMWSYIDANWESQPMFAGQGWGDTRIQRSSLVRSNWLATTSDPAFLKKTPELFLRLHARATNQWRAAATNLDASGRSVTFTNVGSMSLLRQKLLAPRD